MDFVILKSFPNYIAAHLVLTKLKDEGVNAWLKNEATATIMPIWNNALGGIQLMVPANQQQKAAYILKVMEEERREQTACPRCGGREVEYINTVRKPANWLSAAVTFLLGDLALMPEQRYHCFNCGNEWQGS